MNDSLPTLLFYCQHSLGIGHLTRSFALARALQARFRVVFLNGGRLPEGVAVPPGVSCIHLPPLGVDEGQKLVSRDARIDLAMARSERARLIAQAVADTRPALLLVELFPFGRKKFANEILPMIRASRRQGAKVACSLRDILVDGRSDQQHFDDRACWLVNRYFDAVLVHSDPGFARLEDSFRPRRALRVPVWHTGFVVPARTLDAAAQRGGHVIVSAGGGIVGNDLFRAALDAHRRTGVPMRIVAGPFLPEAQWQDLQREAEGLPGVTLLRHVPDLAAQMRVARASISQCGYNTALDLVVSGVPALVVPYATETENEQQQRAVRLAVLGAMQCLDPQRLDGASLAAALPDLLRFQPRPAALALDGAQRSAQLLGDLVIPAEAGTQGFPAAPEHRTPWVPASAGRTVVQVLDALPAPVSIFLRDDDAGWEDARLLALLDVTQRAGVPIDLAAIPAAITPALAAELRRRIDGAPNLLAVHQHGLAHANHEPEGRKSEFGAARGAEAQRADLEEGRALLAGWLDERVQPWFTPPWNRCSALTPRLLAEAGFQAISRDRGAKPAQSDLPELPVDVDWSRQWREGGAAAVERALCQALAQRAADGAPLGLMLHHGAMTGEELQCFAALLAAVSHHPRLRWQGMGELLSRSTPGVLACALPA